MEVKRFIDSCANYIISNDDQTGHKCGPYFPVLFMSFGKTCEKENLDIVRESISKGWTRFKEYLTVMEYPSLSDIDEYFFDELDECMMKLKAAKEGTFRLYNTVKLFVFLNTNDKDFDAYLDLIARIKEEFPECIVVVSLMIDEKARFDRKTLPSKIARVCRLRSQEKIQGLIMLSNQLKNGRNLSPVEEVDNYRIVANIVYISNSYNMEQGQYFPIARELDELILQNHSAITASYLRMSKPVHKMARTILKEIIHIQYLQEQDFIKDTPFEHIMQEFQVKIGRFELDSYFSNITKGRFPNPNEFCYFPYFNKKLIMKHASFEEIRLLMNELTHGMWDLFEQKNFVEPMELYFKRHEEEILAYIKSKVEENFSYAELLAYTKDRERKREVMQKIQQIYAVKENKFSRHISVEQRLYSLGIVRAKEYYYRRISDSIDKILDESAKEAKEFRDIILQVKTALEDGFFTDSLTDYYRKKVLQTFDYRKYQKHLCTPVETMEQYCEQLKQVYQEYVSEFHDIYLTTFEEEIANRLGKSSTNIMEALGFKNKNFFSMECRFDYTGVPSGNTYCLVFEQASFIKELEKQNQEEKIFVTGRQDCAERMMICNFSCQDFILEEETI